MLSQLLLIWMQWTKTFITVFQRNQAKFLMLPLGSRILNLLKLLCQFKEFQEVITQLGHTSARLADRVGALEGLLTSQNQKLAAVEGILNCMNAAKPKAPPPTGPAPDHLPAEAPLPPPPTQPPGQWGGWSIPTQSQPAGSSTAPAAKAAGVGQMPGNLQMPCLHVQAPTTSIAAQQPQGPCFQFGANPHPTVTGSNDMVTVVWEGKPYPMPAALARPMHLQPVQAQQFMSPPAVALLLLYVV